MTAPHDKASHRTTPSETGTAIIAIGLIVVLGAFVVWSSPTWALSEALRQNSEFEVSRIGAASVEPSNSPRPQLVGYGPFNCTAQDVADQAGDWHRMTSGNAGRWMVHCAGHNATLAVHRASPGRQGKVFIDIGANKGVGMTSWQLPVVPR